MKENNKQELSYFRLKLRSYMSEHHPERLHDTEFITARADMALTTYCDAVVQGFTHPEAESIASEVLYQGLHFSKYDTLVSVLENEFERELPAPLPEKLAPILLSNKAVQATFDKFGLTDTFAASGQLRPSLHRTHRHNSAAHQEQSFANRWSDRGVNLKAL